jgi:hypothetical protein
MSLWKTKITVWTESDPSEMELDVLAEAAMYGDAYCSDMKSVLVKHPQEDEDWDDTDFFGDAAGEDDDEEEEELDSVSEKDDEEC